MPFNHANALRNESMREYSHHSIQRILCLGQNSRQNRAQDSVGTYYAVWLKHISPKLLLQSTNLAGMWSFTNDSQFTFSRILWSRVEELQTEKVSIHTGCMNWFDSWEYALTFYTPAQRSWVGGGGGGGGGVYWIHLVRPSVCPTTWFPEHKSSLLWNFNFKFHMHVDGGHRQKLIDFQQCHFQNGRLAAILDFLVSGL